MNAKYLLLGSLYLAQGLPYGFFTQALPVLLREQKLSLPLIGLAQLLTLPWALKFLWAPLVDRVESPRGRRRAVIIPLQLASIAILAVLALAASPEVMWALAVGVLLVNICAATQDIATDALAVETLTAGERGLGNGLQVGAYRVGMVIGGGAILVVFGRAGWTVAFLGMAGLLALVTLPIVLHREAPMPKVPAQTSLLRDSFARPGFGAWVIVLVTYKTGEWFAAAMLRTFLTDTGHTIDDIGIMVGIFGFSAALVGSFAGGALTTRLGRRRALLLFSGLQTLALASMALAVVAPSTAMFYAITIAEHLTSGLATAALFTAMMDFSRPGSAGTDYTVQASIVVIATGLATMLSGFSAKSLGYASHFVLAAGLSAIGLVAVLTYRPRDEALRLQ